MVGLLGEVRAGFAVRRNAPDAVAAGAGASWASGAMGPFQPNAGRAMVAEQQREYASKGATPD
jgi:hypothetical protein